MIYPTFDVVPFRQKRCWMVIAAVGVLLVAASFLPLPSTPVIVRGVAALCGLLALIMAVAPDAR